MWLSMKCDRNVKAFFFLQKSDSSETLNVCYAFHFLIKFELYQGNTQLRHIMCFHCKLKLPLNLKILTFLYQLNESYSWKLKFCGFCLVTNRVFWDIVHWLYLNTLFWIWATPQVFHPDLLSSFAFAQLWERWPFLEVIWGHFRKIM